MSVSTTNVLALPLAVVDISAATNEDWLDSFEYLAAADPNVVGSENVPLDLRGINFELMVRRTPDDPEVIVWASTKEGTIQLGSTPNWNFLIINVPLETMRSRVPGVYIADMIASDELWQRVVMNITLTIVDGITK